MSYPLSHTVSLGTELLTGGSGFLRGGRIGLNHLGNLVYPLINLVDGQDLYFGGNKLEKGAYVEVKVLGSVDAGASDKMTAKVCEILERELGIPGNAVYVSYWGTGCWGWNGGNF